MVKKKLLKSKKKPGKKNPNYIKLKSLIEEFGEWEINCLQLSKKWGVPESTVNRWKHQIVEELGPLDLDVVRKNVPMVLRSNMKLFQRLIRKSTFAKDKVASGRALNDTIKTFTEFAEAYGIKEKIADKVEIKDDSNWKQIMKGLNDWEKKKKKRKVKKK